MEVRGSRWVSETEAPGALAFDTATLFRLTRQDRRPTLKQPR